ncbi:hypothetical protein BC830DRAFT_1120479 [Chytriomyces sp. MP71]|nr:hypothetical protein BC830DRAFT_1120479 [Chytriomyces sp. MP71]
MREILREMSEAASEAPRPVSPAALSTRLAQVAKKHETSPKPKAAPTEALAALASLVSAQLHKPVEMMAEKSAENASTCAHATVLGTLNNASNLVCAKCSAELAAAAALRSHSKAVEDALRKAKRVVAEFADKQLTSAQDLTHLTTRIQTLSQKSHAQQLASHALKSACVLETGKVLDLVEKRLDVSSERDALVEEIEGKTQELFEKANGLVADEAKRRFVSQTRVRALESELEDLEGQLSMERLQMSELRAKMEELRSAKATREAKQAALVAERIENDAAQDVNSIEAVTIASVVEQAAVSTPPQEPTFTPTPSATETPLPVPVARLRTGSNNALSTPPSPQIEMDAQLLSDLHAFMQECGPTKLTKLHTLPFLKTCLEEDVLPCLKFGNSPRTATRRLVDAILVNSCFVEEMSAVQVAALREYHERLQEAVGTQTAHGARGGTGAAVATGASTGSPTSPGRQTLQQANAVVYAAVAAVNGTPTYALFQRTVLQALWTTAASSREAVTPLPASIILFGCPACGCAPAVTRHHFKVSESATDQWVPICSHCHARILAVCEFYNFVRHLKLGLYSTRAEKDIYMEVLGLRSRMWEARCGGGFSVQVPGAPGGGFVGVGSGKVAKSLRPDSVLFEGMDS